MGTELKMAPKKKTPAKKAPAKKSPVKKAISKKSPKKAAAKGDKKEKVKRAPSAYNVFMRRNSRSSRSPTPRWTTRSASRWQLATGRSQRSKFVVGRDKQLVVSGWL